MSDYLLVHGGFNGGWVWDDVAERLEKAGHEVRVVDQLPSAGTDPASLGDLTTDANHVRQVLDTIDEPVVLVGHSYGGMVHHRVSRPPEGAAQRLSHRVLAAPGPVLAGPARWARTRDMLSRFVLQSAAAFDAPSTAPDRAHPTTYMIATP
jgi:pimeloyl-ACP methyl ester carboxylesterase